MTAEDMVDAALVGYDMREFATVPALADAGLWEQFEAKRRDLHPHLSAEKPASRYSAAALASTSTP